MLKQEEAPVGGAAVGVTGMEFAPKERGGTVYRLRRFPFRWAPWLRSEAQFAAQLPDAALADSVLPR